MSKKWFVASSILTFLLLAVAISGTVIPQTAAQGDNLLGNPGFEDNSNVVVVDQDPGSGTNFNTFAPWNGWWTDTPSTADWQNLMPNGTIRNDAGAGFVKEGNRSMEISRGSATFTAAIYQTVSVSEGDNVQAEASVVMNITPGEGNSLDDANSTAKIGIDPTGGTNPNSGDVVWSSTVVNQLATSGFRELSVNATAGGSQVTLFLYATQTFPTKGNGVFWDDTSLTVGGPGGPSGGEDTSEATPTPTPPPYVEFVNPQETREDGSIVHVVQEGDVLASIAVAYNVSQDQIRELNPEIGEGRFLRVGQELLIREATDTGGNQNQSQDTGDGGDTQPTVTSTPIPPATSTPQPTSVAQASTPTPTSATSGSDPITDEQDTSQQAMTAPDAQADAGIQVNTLYYWVNDIQETRTFYTDILGLEETNFINQEDSTPQLVYDVNGVEMVFQEASEEQPVQEDFAIQPDYDGGTLESASLSIQMDTPSFDAVVNQVTQNSVPVYQNSIIVTQVGERSLFLQDPMGKTVQVLNVQQN